MTADGHDHPHEPTGHDGEPPAAARVRALEELLVERRASAAQAGVLPRI